MSPITNFYKLLGVHEPFEQTSSGNNKLLVVPEPF